MHLNISTDYAIRMVLYLAEKKAACSVKGIIGTAAYSTELCLKSCRYLEKSTDPGSGYWNRWRYAAREASKRHPHL